MLGFNDAWHELTEADHDRAVEAGALTARVPFGWTAYRDSMALRAQVAQQMDCFTVRGVEPHLCLSASVRPDPTEYAAVCAEVADLYAGRIRGIEVMNEPNSPAHGDYGPAGYLALFEAVYAAIRATRPGMSIVTAGLSPGVSNWAWALKQISRGAPADVILGAHIYPRGSAPSGPQAREALELVIDAATVDGKDRKVWVTETGISSGEYSEAQQAARLGNVLGVYEEFPRVKTVCVHRLRDNPEYEGGDPEWEQGLGVLRSDGTPKPAFWSLTS